MFSAFGTLLQNNRLLLVQEYGANGTANWHSFVVPPQASFVGAMFIGPGSGGGGGCGGTASSARGGGGGGARGQHTCVIYPARAIPKKTFIYISPGGVGGAGGTNASGTAGGNTTFYGFQWDIAYTSSDNTYLARGNQCIGGGGGTAAAGGAAGSSSGSGGTAGHFAPHRLMLATSTGAHGGTAGGAQTGAVGGAGSILSGNGLPMFNSTGGGGCGISGTEFAGGVCAIINNTPYIYTHAGGVAGGGAGQPGYCLYSGGNRYWTASYGATGGGSSNSTTGGRGGDGVLPGVGGGGGGAGTTTGGAGGNGGDGYAMLIAW